MHSQSNTKIPLYLKDINQESVIHTISNIKDKILDLDKSFFKNEEKSINMYFNPGDFELIKYQHTIHVLNSYGNFFIKCCVDNHLQKGEQYIMLDYTV
jgi:hypothetical protein